MIEVEGQLKKVGNSVALLVPKKSLEEGQLKAGQTVRALIAKKTNPIKETFGAVRFNRPISEILRETDQEAWDD